jgi:tripartite-type tricarboxylate transporter receptor subunit TctC
MPTCATECLIEYIAKPQARGQSCLKDCGRHYLGTPSNSQGRNWMRVHYWLVLALAVLAGFPATAQTAYPDRPIKMIVPLAAASAVDVAARIVTQKMADNMGQQFVIMNQPGASGLIGAEQVARAEPDGYTIGGFNDSIMTMVPICRPKCAGTS